MDRIKRIFAIILLTIFIATPFSLCIAPSAAAAVDEKFERSISDFPESYKPKLRKLHELYPKWKFVAFETGINWSDAVNQEQAYDRSLFPLSCSSIYKSKASGDYNYTGDYYIQKDGGFVTANKAAVAYYMDPRNFLDVTSIFQFESLEYSDEFNEEAVEFVLKGSFMADTKISYFNSDGKIIKTSKKYSTAICEAGKKHNVNPCYLASKIINEVGLSGSGSVSGKNKNYPGIYNFYNIGAYDGAGAIERGLKWASTGTTYSRPWNTPAKSITGGAEFIAESYIAEGQFTPYLQKFNVNPNAGYRLYEHQYMTNVCGAVIQAYSSYLSYKSSDLLSNSFVFSIPVFKNMDDEKGTDGTITLSESRNQSGVVAGSGCNVRKGPSTRNDKYSFQLNKGAKVSILGLVPTDSDYYLDYLNYPYWYKIKFTYDSKSYTGYMPQSFISLSTSSSVPVGTYNPSFDSKDGKKLRLVSFDERIATIQNDYSILFKKEGKVSIAAYDSTGRMSIVQYNVAKAKRPDTVTGLAQSSITSTSYTLSWNKSADATGYTVCRYNTKTGLFDPIKTTTATKLEIKSKTPGQLDTYVVRSIKKLPDDSVLNGYDSEPLVAATKPQAPSFSSQSGSSSSGYTLNWSKSTNANGYKVQIFDENSGKFIDLQSTSENKLKITSLKPVSSNKYRVRAYIRIDGKNIYSSYSDTFVASTSPKPVSDVKVSSITSTSFTLSWKASAGAEGYRVYKKDAGSSKYTLIATVDTNKAVINDCAPGTRASCIVRSYIRVGKSVITSEYKDVTEIITKPSKVSALKQTSTTAYGYTLTWNAVSGADGYQIYRYDTAAKKYVKAGTVSTNKYTVKDLKPGTVTKYKVRAFSRLKGKAHFGSFSSVLSAASSPLKVSSLSLSKVSGTKYTVKWSKTAGADGYKLYRYDSAKKKYVCIATTSKTSAAIKASVKKGTETLYVKAYRDTGSSLIYGTRSPILKVIINTK